MDSKSSIYLNNFKHCVGMQIKVQFTDTRVHFEINNTWAQFLGQLSE